MRARKRRIVKRKEIGKEEKDKDKGKKRVNEERE